MELGHDETARATRYPALMVPDLQGPVSAKHDTSRARCPTNRIIYNRRNNQLTCGVAGAIVDVLCQQRVPGLSRCLLGVADLQLGAGKADAHGHNGQGQESASHCAGCASDQRAGLRNASVSKADRAGNGWFSLTLLIACVRCVGHSGAQSPRSQLSDTQLPRSHQAPRQDTGSLDLVHIDCKKPTSVGCGLPRPLPGLITVGTLAPAVYTPLFASAVTGRCWFSNTGYRIVCSIDSRTDQTSSCSWQAAFVALLI
jgi:hypothetical protein